MEVRAVAKGVRVSPQKVRPIIDLVRGKGVDEALAILKFLPSPTARLVSKVLRSAIANAENNFEMAPSELVVTKAYVNEGPRLKRIRFKGRGRINPILKRSSHITIVVEER